MGYGFGAFKPDFWIILSAIRFASSLRLIATHLVVILKSLERPNYVLHMMSLLRACVSPTLKTCVAGYLHKQTVEQADLGRELQMQ
ncbi:hypothetical protein DP117_13630 [Brasilonema sp. UFV-L1]|nr:hypothetical protein [Brasilonema sp. UFV-L1]